MHTRPRYPHTPLLPPAGQPHTDRPDGAPAYATVLSLYLLAAGPNLLTALLILTEFSGTTAPASLRTAAAEGRPAGIAAATVWLACLLLTRARRSHTRPWRALMVLSATALVIAADESGYLSRDHEPTQVVGHLVELPLWIWLCIEITARLGITLRQPPLPRPYHRLGTLTREDDRTQVIGWTKTYSVYTLVLLAAPWLGELLTYLPGPAMEGDQATAAGVPDFWPGLAHGTWSATIEELLATAAVVAVLTVARRPLWETLTVVAVMRTLPHAYLGLWPMFAAVVPALAAAWLYHRHRQAAPLILAHVLYNTVGAFGETPWRFIPLTLLALLTWGSIQTAKKLAPAATTPGHPVPDPATDETTTP